MADFQATHYIMLTGVTETPSQLSWTGQANNVNSAMVTDVGADGILTENSDSYISGSTYSGWYVTVDGENFGIFNTGPFWLIPYNHALTNLGLGVPIASEITNGSTNQFDATLENAANCFLTGTRIATPSGARPIEALHPGDPVLTADGRATPVLWVWRQEITNVFGLGEARAPIRIAAHALGPGCPARDLVVTADHALFLDGFLINAGALVNGTTIAPVPLSRMPPRFTYWHLETEAHSVLLAENCPAESFIDYTPRTGFDNFADFVAHGGRERLIEEMPLPRISTARLLLPALRQRLGIDRVA